MEFVSSTRRRYVSFNITKTLQDQNTSSTSRIIEGLCRIFSRIVDVSTNEHSGVDIELNMLLNEICTNIGLILFEIVQATFVEAIVQKLSAKLASSLSRIFERAFPAVSEKIDASIPSELIKLIEDKVKLKVEPLRQHIKDLEAELIATKQAVELERKDRLEAEEQIKKLIDNIIRDIREFRNTYHIDFRYLVLAYSGVRFSLFPNSSCP